MEYALITVGSLHKSPSPSDAFVVGVNLGDRTPHSALKFDSVREGFIKSLIEIVGALAILVGV